MDWDSFDELLELVGPHTRKQDTVTRKAIPPAVLLESWSLMRLASSSARLLSLRCSIHGI